MDNKHKYLKRLLAFVLSLAMIITYMPVSLIAYAADESQDHPVAEETQAAPDAVETETPAETPSAPEATQPEASTDDKAPAAEPAEEAKPETDAKEEPAEGAAEETPDKEEVTYAEQSFEGTAGAVSVTVYAPEGALPEGTTMKVKSVGVFGMSSVKKAVKDELGSNAEVVKAVDITFYDKDGAEIQPEKAVSVSFDSAKFEDLDQPAVVHIDDSKKAEKLADKLVDADGSEVAFTADSFSVYVVVETGTDARLNVVFHQANGAETTMKVKQNDLNPDKISDIIYDPGAGDLSTDGTTLFLGWTINKDYTADTASMTIEDIRGAIKDRLSEKVKEGDTLDVYAMLFKQYNVKYVDEYDTSLGVETVPFRADSNEATQNYVVSQTYTPEDNDHNFEGWNVKEGGDSIEGYTEGTVYVNDTSIRISGDVTFSVNAPAGHWLIFNENGKGATYNAPVFLKTGEVTTKPCDDSDMVRNGYKFGGWYTDADCTSEFAFGQGI